MKKLAIFDEVVTILREDSSTKKDIAGADPALFRERISEDMPEAEFLYTMHAYLASFGILSHLSFYPKGKPVLGFRLRRYENALYVLDAKGGTGLQKGDRIEKLDGIPLSDYYQQHQEFFVSSSPERQYLDWGLLVKVAQSIEVVRQGELLQLTVGDAVESFDKTGFEAYFIQPDTYYLKMENFHDEAAIGALYQEALPEMTRAKYVIIDVRINHGGSDSLYFPLFPYALPAGQKFKDLEADEGFGMEILYTKTNVAHRLKQFEAFLKDPALSPESRKMIEEFSEDLLANQDKGYLTYGEDSADSEDTFSRFVGLEEAPEKIVLLADVTCGSSGDNFVDIMKKMPKVTVIGRPTLGILDYSNCCVADFGDYELLYPTSRSLAIDAGCGMTDIGVLPDIEVPWKPEHLTRDIDLEVALSYLGN